MFKHLALAAAVTIATFGSTAQAQENRDYLLATASTGGTYYPVGVALATLTKVKLTPTQKIGMSARQMAFQVPLWVSSLPARSSWILWTIAVTMDSIM